MVKARTKLHKKTMLLPIRILNQERFWRILIGSKVTAIMLVSGWILPSGKVQSGMVWYQQGNKNYYRSFWIFRQFFKFSNKAISPLASAGFCLQDRPGGEKLCNFTAGAAAPCDLFWITIMRRKSIYLPYSKFAPGIFTKSCAIIFFIIWWIKFTKIIKWKLTFY